MSIENNILRLSGSIQMKRGTAAALAASNYVPAAGEFIVETDTNRIKIGNGVSNYANLSYSAIQLPPSDNSIYVMCNGQWIAARVYEAPEAWQPEITSSSSRALTVDEDMQPWELTANNGEVNTNE